MEMSERLLGWGPVRDRKGHSISGHDDALGWLLSQEQRAQKEGSAKITEEARSQGTHEHCAETSCYYGAMRFRNQEMASSERHADGVNPLLCLPRTVRPRTY